MSRLGESLQPIRRSCLDVTDRNEVFGNTTGPRGNYLALNLGRKKYFC